MTSQGLNSRTELPAPLLRVKATGSGGLLPTPSASGSGACGVGPPCVPAGLGQEPWEWAGPPGTHRAAWRTAYSEKGKMRIAGLEEVPTCMGPEHGAVTRASVCPLTPNPPPPAKAPQPKGAGLRKGSCRRAPARESQSILLGAAPRDLSPGALGPRGHAARGRSQPHRAEERGRHLPVLLRLAWSCGHRPEPCSSRFPGPRRVRADRDPAHQNLHTGWSQKAGGQGRRLPGRDGLAVGSTGARELGARPAGSKAHCHQRPVIAGTERNWESAPHDPRAAASSPRPARLTTPEPAQHCLFTWKRPRGTTEPASGEPRCPALTYMVLKRTDARRVRPGWRERWPRCGRVPRLLTWKPYLSSG